MGNTVAALPVTGPDGRTGRGVSNNCRIHHLKSGKISREHHLLCKYSKIYIQQANNINERIGKGQGKDQEAYQSKASQEKRAGGTRTLLAGKHPCPLISPQGAKRNPRPEGHNPPGRGKANTRGANMGGTDRGRGPNGHVDRATRTTGSPNQKEAGN